MRKESLEALTLTVNIEWLWFKGKHIAVYLKSLWKLCKWTIAQGAGVIVKRQTLLRSTNDRKLWRSMRAYVLSGLGWWKKKKQASMELCTLNDLRNYLIHQGETACPRYLHIFILFGTRSRGKRIQWKSTTGESFCQSDTRSCVKSIQ